VQANLDWVSERGETDDLNDFVFQQPHFQQALRDPVLAEEGLHARPLAEPQFIERGHSSPRNQRPDQDLRGQAAAQAQPAAADLQEAGFARPQHAQPAALGDAKFGQPPHPTSLAPYLGHVGPLVGAEMLKREQIVLRIHHQSS